MRFKIVYDRTDESSNIICSFCKKKMPILCEYTLIILEEFDIIHQNFKFTNIRICQECIEQKVIYESEFEIGDIHLDFGLA